MMNTEHITTRPVDERAYKALQAAGIDPLLARLYAARSIHHIEETDISLRALLPFDGLKNIQAAAQRLAEAITRQERILIVADYDADGATACALGIRGLAAMGGCVDFLVPNRFEHGYGLTPELAELAAARQTQLLLTVDNGIASVAGVAKARQLNMDVLITDHHLPGNTLPDCLIVNPNQPNDAFGSKALAGVGVMFYVLMALRSHLRRQHYFGINRPEPNLANWLDLVALGTVADVVPLDHNNRILVTQGLNRIRAGKTHAGIRALFDVAKRNIRQAQSFDLGFAIGPRLNAAGRLDDMSLGITCLVSDDDAAATLLAEQLDQLNRERRQIEHGMLDEALADLPETVPDQCYSTVVYRPQWHQGVIGIVASRLRERFHRPTIVFAPADNGEWRGSGRSIPALHLRDALDLISKRHPSLIHKFGGHAMAAGLSLAEEGLTDFQAAFEAVCRELLQPQDLTAQHLTDGHLPSPYLNLPTARELAQHVWGQGFSVPSFCDEFDVLWQKPVGTQHLKAGLLKDNQTCEAMFFRCTETLPQRIRVVYRPTVNEWRGQQELQLYVDYWEPENGPGSPL